MSLSDIASKFTVTPLLYAVGVLVLMNLGTGALLWKRGVDLDKARGDLHVVQQDADTANRHVTELDTARKGWEEVANNATAIIAKMAQDATDLGKANAAAITAAETARATAEKSAATYHSKFLIESKKPDCAHALAALQASCPALEGY